MYKLITLFLAFPMVVHSLVYAYDDVLTNNEFNYTKAWRLAKTLDRAIDCNTISYNPVVDNLERTYDNLSDTYDRLLNLYNNHSLLGLYNNLPETYYNDLYKMLTVMYNKLNDIRSDINNHTAGNFETGLHCAGFNMAYEIYKGYKEANHTRPN